MRTPEKAAQKISSALGPDYSVKTAAQENELYYRIMNTENIVLYFAFALIVAIALFNVAGSVVMLILDKKEDIRTMRALGGGPVASIVAIFVTEGMMVVGGRRGYRPCRRVFFGMAPGGVFAGHDRRECEYSLSRDVYLAAR